MVFEPNLKINWEEPKTSFAEWIFQQYRKRAAEGKIAMVWADKGIEISYGDLLRDAVQVATAFRDIGAKSGEVIAVVARNSPEAFAFVIGGVLADMIISNSILESNSSELAQNFETTKPRYILTQPEVVMTVQEAISTLTLRPEIILLNENTLKEFLSRGSHASPDTFVTTPVANLRRHVLLYSFSSGTTGKQKAIMIGDHGFLKYGLSKDTFGAAYYQSDAGLLFCSHQISWISAYSTMLTCVQSGRPWLFTTATDTESLLNSIHKFKPTSYYCVPSIIYEIRNAIERHPGRWDISSLREIITIGDRIAADVHKKLSEELKVNIYQIYGATEYGYITCVDVGQKPIYGSSGKLRVPIKLVNQETEEEITDKNKVGEIRLRKDRVSPYLGDIEEYKDAFDQDGWFKTGDTAYLDDEGNLFYVDRLREMLRYKGFKVAPKELDNYLRTIAGVAEAAVAGKNDDMGCLITAFVVKKPNANITEEDIKTFWANKKFHDSKQLRGGVIFVDELPTNSSGKILRRRLAEYVNTTAGPKIIPK